MKTLILGGHKSGKSSYAEQLGQASGKPVTLIATAQALDDEMALRIQRHRDERPRDWQVSEEPLALGQALRTSTTTQRFVIVDCLTLWLTQLLCLNDPARLQFELQSLLEAVDDTHGDLVLIGNETSMGVIPLGQLTRDFCDHSGWLHQRLAERCDRVILTIAGLPQLLKGSPAATQRTLA